MATFKQNLESVFYGASGSILACGNIANEHYVFGACFVAATGALIWKSENKKAIILSTAITSSAIIGADYKYDFSQIVDDFQDKYLTQTNDNTLNKISEFPAFKV